ncbi:MAG: tRNA glutamyl-Q(34) synthetase GluQRS [Propionibacteriaceae bacterium]|nr:tRNA glutamyl-Q(34) synthetase GluQRS [Propionibacteriaceae bacterium]
MRFGRFAPTPSGQLHLGNLRTALVAYLAARASGRGFLIRVEDLDQIRLVDGPTIEQIQLADLAALGLTSDAAIIHQSDRFDRYQEAIDALGDRIYPCFCSRKDLRTAAVAPHGATPIYPGTCRHLSPAERRRRAAGRTPAWRVNTDDAIWTVADDIHGEVTRQIDDFVVRRADGVFAYNLAVVVDDGQQGVDQVVRGDDLLDQAPRQAWLADQLGYTQPTYLHLPLVLDSHGDRLAKRDGALGLAALTTAGMSVEQVLTHLAVSLDLAVPAEAISLDELVGRFDPDRLPHQPWLIDPPTWID